MKKLLLSILLTSLCAQTGAMQKAARKAGATLMQTAPARIARNFAVGGLCGTGIMTGVKEGYWFEKNVYPIFGYDDHTWNKLAVGSGYLGALCSGNLFGIAGFKVMSDACPYAAGIKEKMSKNSDKQNTAQTTEQQAAVSAQNNTPLIKQIADKCARFDDVVHEKVNTCFEHFTGKRKGS